MMTALDLEFAVVEVTPALAAQVKMNCPMNPQAIGKAMQQGFRTVMAFVNRHGLKMVGQPRAIYMSYSAEEVSFVLALPIASGEGRDVEEPDVFVDNLPGKRAYRFTHHGSYPNLARTYGQITEFMKHKGLMQSEADWSRFMPMWEEYISDPEVTPESELVTYIYLPVV